MEPGELKAVLYDSLQKRGILESLKVMTCSACCRNLRRRLSYDTR